MYHTNLLVRTSDYIPRVTSFNVYSLCIVYTCVYVMTHKPELFMVIQTHQTNIISETNEPCISNMYILFEDIKRMYIILF